MRLTLIEKALVDNRDMLYKVAVKYLKNHDDVLDALQETAYKAVKNSHKVKNEEYILTWVVRILINTCLQMLRQNKRFETVEFDEGAFYANPVEIESGIELSDLLLKLNKNQRDAIIMKYVEGYKIREIAEIYKKPEGTVKTWLRRGLESLGSEVENYD